ncbi:patatin-like phospholipase domain-containing protein 4 [Dreissena polymorpha]|uniref:PNPLA domain-containing protein n=1 Tax=Dreissena polymorpha TaxID=45954 RepID=A0A9D4G4T2_DREPO|nr:patatin-like phospholipase domain-containing protein 4 [Dreissena polymorpha]XP_052215860.1 patatin-like phospholipase domain-containing protein 4 [Dreissena polymorpha]XP_052215861.1 patatin-like phospholipase domain-containing protein 4 [Dreissena polymorpha]KAH3810564.1 hypothetical protein DPMN_138958 [Dreissena polymorpha]
MNISFCGSGFLSIYQIGSLKALLTKAPKFVAGIEKVGGASGGALTAAILVCEPHRVDDCKQFTLDLAEDVRKRHLRTFSPTFHLLKPVKEFMKDIVSENAYQKANGVLHVSLSLLEKFRLPQSRIVSSFSSNDQLIQSLICSCFIPGYVGFILPKLNGKYCIDGGFKNNLVGFPDGRTITVSPFSGDQDICPNEQTASSLTVRMANQAFVVNRKNVKRAWQCVFPPPRDVLLYYYDLGYHDTVRFLSNNYITE